MRDAKETVLKLPCNGKERNTWEDQMISQNILNTVEETHGEKDILEK